MAPTFLGGKLKLKGKKKKKSKHKTADGLGGGGGENGNRHKTKEDKITNRAEGDDDDNNRKEDVFDDDELTPTERRSLKLKKERETQELEKNANQSHRDRIEDFNEKLGKLTEHNDIPRVSFLGWGWIRIGVGIQDVLMMLLLWLLRCPLTKFH